MIIRYRYLLLFFNKYNYKLKKIFNNDKKISISNNKKKFILLFFIENKNLNIKDLFYYIILIYLFTIN